MQRDAFIFTVQDTAISWTDAEANATSEGGHLASLATPGEETFVLGVINAHPELLSFDPHDGAQHGLWFGLHQVDDGSGGKQWAWSDGTVYDYRDWQNGQPDGLPSPNADYGLFWLPGGGTLGWADQINQPTDAGYGAVTSYVTEFDQGSTSIFGTAYEDLIYAGTGKVGSLIIAGQGDDWVYGSGAADTIEGGEGRDRLFGANGDDRLRSEGDNDRLNGGGGSDDYVFDAFTTARVAVIGNLDAMPSSFAGSNAIAKPPVDQIDVSNIDADTSQDGVQHFVQVSAFDGTAAEMVAVYHDRGGRGGHTTFMFDTDGDGQADYKLLAEHGDYTHFNNWSGVDTSGFTT